MKLKRRGVLAFLSACLPLLLARRSVARVPVKDPLLFLHPGPWPDGVRPRRRHWCSTCAMMDSGLDLIPAAPDRERLPLPENVQDDGPFSPAAMAAARDARMARWQAERPERARERARMICESG